VGRDLQALSKLTVNWVRGGKIPNRYLVYGFNIANYSSFSHDDLVDDIRMFNMDETSHIATQRHETIAAQKIKQLGATVFWEYEHNMTGVLANNSSGISAQLSTKKQRRKTKTTFRGPPLANYCSILSEESLAAHRDVLWMGESPSISDKTCARREFGAGLRWPELQLVTGRRGTVLLRSMSHWTYRMW